MPFLNYKTLKAVVRVFLADHIVAMITYYVMKKTSLPIVGQLFDTVM